MVERWKLRPDKALDLFRHPVRDQGVGGSNPLAPTIIPCNTISLLTMKVPRILIISAQVFVTFGRKSNRSALSRLASAIVSMARRWTEPLN